jgi:PAS domain S-box-containing protein
VSASRSRAVAYALAVASVVAATAARTILPLSVVDALPFLGFFAAIVATSWIGGFGPGLVATMLSTGAAYRMMLAQRLRIGGGSAGGSAIRFLVVGVVASWLIDRLARARESQEQAIARLAAQNESLKQSELARRRLASIVESSDDSIVAIDRNGVIMSWNLGAERLYGYTSEEAIGQPTALVVAPDRRAEEEQVLARIWAGAPGEQFETQRVRKDGSRVDVSATISPIRDESGAIIGASKIARDISERRRAERVREELLRQADELNRLKDDFLATLSHELRTPLSAILGWARMLAGNQLDAEAAARAVRAIERNAEAQSHIVDDILDLAQGTTGNVRLESKRLDLVGVAHRGLDAIAPAASAKHLSVEVDTPQPVIVVGDAPRLQQVAWNLMSNAVKFTEPGGRITVAVNAIDSTAELRVVDTGIGISPEFLPHVFDKFRQQDSSTTRRHGGLGLGLAIARHLVELHGGSIEAQSGGDGSGSMFVVRLPLADGQTPQ